MLLRSAFSVWMPDGEAVKNKNWRHPVRASLAGIDTDNALRIYASLPIREIGFKLNEKVSGSKSDKRDS